MTPRELPFVKKALASIDKGGYAEALARVAFLLAHKDEPLPLSRLQLAHELIEEYRELLPELAPDEVRRIGGEQEIIARYEPEKAVADAAGAARQAEGPGSPAHAAGTRARRPARATHPALGRAESDARAHPPRARRRRAGGCSRVSRKSAIEAAAEQRVRQRPRGACDETGGRSLTPGTRHMKTISLHDAVAMIPDGARLMIGGFMGVGTPERVIDELVRQGKRDLTVIANDNALPGIGIGKLVSAGLIRRTIASHIGLNPETQKKMLAGEMQVDLVPQGTLIERIRAGGFGLGGILTATGVGTVVEEGKRRIEVDGKPYLLETALRADFALVQAFVADYLGNLQYALTARNFNPVIALAADTVIVEAENIVPVGVIGPDQVTTPAPIVDYLIANG